MATIKTALGKLNSVYETKARRVSFPVVIHKDGHIPLVVPPCYFTDTVRKELNEHSVGEFIKTMTNLEIIRGTDKVSIVDVRTIEAHFSGIQQRYKELMRWLLSPELVEPEQYFNLEGENLSIYLSSYDLVFFFFFIIYILLNCFLVVPAAAVAPIAPAPAAAVPPANLATPPLLPPLDSELRQQALDKLPSFSPISNLLDQDWNNDYVASNW